MSRDNLFLKNSYPGKTEVASRYTISNLWLYWYRCLVEGQTIFMKLRTKLENKFFYLVLWWFFSSIKICYNYLKDIMNFFARPFYLKNDLKGKMKITLFFISYMVARTILKHHCMSGGELLEMRLLDKKWNRSFFYLPYVYQYLT